MQRERCSAEPGPTLQRSSHIWAPALQRTVEETLRCVRGTELSRNEGRLALRCPAIASHSRAASKPPKADHAPAHPALIVVDVQRAFDEWRPRASGATIRMRWRASSISSQRSGHRRADLPHPPRGYQAELDISASRSGYAVKDEAREQRASPSSSSASTAPSSAPTSRARLRAANITTLVICGATTNHCVETTTRMAGNLGFDARLVRDATWTFDRIGPDGERIPPRRSMR